MARARNLKPSFFMNEILAECEPLARLLFAGLWTIADREGRVEDRPKKIKAELLPYDECDCEHLLGQLAEHQFILRYKSGENRYIQITNFAKHQNPHVKEAASTIPAPGESGASPVQNVPLPLTPFPLTDPPFPQPDGAATDFQRVFEAGIELYPQLAPQNTSTIHQWLGAGCSIDLDILPELRRLVGKASPRSWGYFTGTVMDAKATREKPPQPGSPRQTDRATAAARDREARQGAVTL